MFLTLGKIYPTRALRNGFSSFKRDFLSGLKIFPKPLATAPKGEKRSSKLEEKILEGANTFSKLALSKEKLRCSGLGIRIFFMSEDEGRGLAAIREPLR